MNCKEATYKIETLKPNEVLPDDVKTHIDSCTRCNDYFRFISTIDHINLFVEDVHADEDLPKKILAFVNSNKTKSKQINLWQAVSGIAAALILGFFLGNTLFNQNTVQHNSTNTSAQKITPEQNYMAQTTELIYYDIYLNETASNEE